ncbi:MAG TPA: hypothetical protein VFI57_11920, partial [Pyrinomonadaceae bacterium]|nr:hypothetical protein [Pyrinomonadaceae bacterium]
MRLILVVIITLGSAVAVFSQSADTTDPLVRVLQSKGILTESEARAITANASTAEQRDRLAALLRDKGVISATEFEALRTPAAAAEVKTITAEYKTSAPPPVAPKPQPAPAVIAAVAPVRLMGIDAPKREGLIPDIKLGTGARLKFYGIFKTSLIHDSSSPQGNDFPLPLLAADTGPNGSPEFHMRARGLRLGANFEWLDPAPKTTITGKIEFDFEGDFTRVNNRNITSIRSSQPSLRLAWVRIDRRFSDANSTFVLFGQDWSPFVASTLPNMIENTNFGGIGYGAAYTRIPQAKFGFNHKFGGSRAVQFQPEIAIVLPAFGNLPSDVSNQLAFGERQGADSQQPGIQGRA